MREDEVESFARAIIELKKNIFTCTVCGGISDCDICSVCSDENRDFSVICIVEEAKDLLTIEGTGEYKGVFHVLGGLISPLDGIGPDDLNLSSLLEKCGKGIIEEVILALNPSVEGEATALYIAGLINPLGIKVTRIAHGLPIGGDIEFADNADSR